jgi:tetratricopeptide (TPR) repeat protein
MKRASFANRRSFGLTARISILQRCILSFLGCLILIGAAPNTPPDDLIRQGNKAIEKDEYEAALQLYLDAEERGTDPGLIAFNKAAAYWHLGEFRMAENHYRMALDDQAAPTERRVKAFYNLGNCLVKQAKEGDYGLLREAIRYYEYCLDLATDEEILKKAKHNLELAKLLWNQARASSANPPTPNSNEPSDTPRQPKPKNKPDSKKENDTLKNDDGKDPKKETDPKKVVKGNEKVEPTNDPNKTDTPQPGPGRVPVIPDNDKLSDLDATDVKNALDAAEYRLNEIRKRLRGYAATPEKPSGKDW